MDKKASIISTSGIAIESKSSILWKSVFVCKMQMYWEQRMLAGEPKFEASQDIPDVNYAAFAELVGLKGTRIDQPGQIDVALNEVLNSDCPAVLDVVCDPNVPIIPPHVDMTMLSKFSKAMMKGDPESSSVIRQAIKQAMQGGSSL